jgi:two-component system response regulator HydG
VVCATHRDLSLHVREGRFREDLYYRLKVLSLEMPPLRARRDDILPLACHFLAEEETQAAGFSAAARERLLAYDWPGNVRELRNAVKHGAALATGTEVHDDDLPDELKRTVARHRPEATARASLRTLAEIEREHILQVLDACEGSPSEAARVLGIARNTLWRKLRQHT